MKKTDLEKREGIWNDREGKFRIHDYHRMARIFSTDFTRRQEYILRTTFFFLIIEADQIIMQNVFLPV